MELTTEQRAVISHVVVDADAWVAHAIATVGEEAVLAKIKRHRESYELARAAQGQNYKTRAEREAE